MRFIKTLGFSALLSFLVIFNPNFAGADTIKYELDGKLNGALKPVNSAKDSEVFSSTLSNGYLEYDELEHILTAGFDFDGIISEAIHGPTIGTLSGSVLYAWDNVLSLQLKNSTSDTADDSYLLALTDQNHNNRPVQDGQGDGVGRLTMNINHEQSFVIDLNGKAANFAISSPALGLYNPVTAYVRKAGENPYFVLGDLNGISGTSADSWFMSEVFTLHQGPGDTGNYFITGDLHGTATEVPEPASRALLCSGLIGALLRRTRGSLEQVFKRV